MVKQDWSFQEDAIKDVLKDFKEEPSGNFLLVIPTGGGKTITALRIINEMIKTNFLDKNDRVIWAVHRKQLKVQAENALNDPKNIKKFKFFRELRKVLEIRMKVDANKRIVADRSGKYKLMVIDEAHHSAADSYKRFFTKNIGILGLTATPTRTDDSELEFDKISYSITFRKLVEKGVILKPDFHYVNSSTSISARSLDNSMDGELNKFDTTARNSIIAREIFKRKKYYQKVIIFVSTNSHVVRLYEEIRKMNKFYNSPFEHVGYIYGGNHNEKDISNEEYLKQHKKMKSSILVNCRLLNEGYDDPSINVVVMAVPTKSILYYMQCVGRVVRNPHESQGSKAYVMELVDDLPNISYRIDNKWLFADISDYLEPVVIEEGISDEKKFPNRIKDIFKEHNIDKKYFKKIKDLGNPEEVSLMLLCSTEKVGEDSKWKPLIIYKENRERYVKVFNRISNNISRFFKHNHSRIIFDILKIKEDDEYFGDRTFISDFFSSLYRAYEEIQKNKKVERLKYINFINIEEYPDGLLEFIKDCYNKDFLLEKYNNYLSENKTYLLKFPLVLGGWEGFYSNERTFSFCQEFINILKDIKSNQPINVHENKINEAISNLENVPLPLKYIHGMIRIAREEKIEYMFKINGDE